MTEAFSLGSVVLPAVDSVLAGLGHDIRRLGESALGMVTETKQNKALIQFPELKTSLWLDKDEMADVEYEASRGRDEYKKLLPDFNSSEIQTVWWLWRLSRLLKPSHVLGFESAKLRDLWDENEAELRRYTGAAIDTAAIKLSLGLGEVFVKNWHEVEALLGEKLLFARFLPAGMYKIELALFLKA